MALEKFKKAIEKKDFNVGFSPIPDWITTGNLALDAILSGVPGRAIPVGRTCGVSGLKGTGKSFLNANIMKNAQDKGYFCVLLDTENSLGEGFMEKIGVDLDPERFMVVTIYSVEEALSFVSELFKNTDPEDKIGIFIDSLANLELEGDIKKNEEGKVAYGQGLLQKQYKQLIRFINTKVGQRNAFCFFTAHEYVAGSDAYGNPITKPSVGEGTMYLPSIAFSLKSSDLKDGKEQTGIIIRAQATKTRYTMNKQKCDIQLPWDRGMDKYDGLAAYLEKVGVIARNGAWYSFVNESGEQTSFQGKNIAQYADQLLARFSEIEIIPEMDEDEANIAMIEAEEQQ